MLARCQHPMVAISMALDAKINSGVDQKVMLDWQLRRSMRAGV